ncbi:uncharacterized protein BKA78DRAFT_297701 [Phyllosticta capitalensis]|uniref:uncharacterized protein n=1 Tax=Phyllosticta capitalensis TaxID=121624 RepID=UPI003130CC5D
MPDADGLAIIGSRRTLKDLPPIDTSVTNVPRQPSLRWSRTRPVVPLQDDRLAANANPTFTSTVDNRKSTMSLFHLFSRPKVERARGHHEPGLTALREPKTTTALSPVTATPSSLQKQMQSRSVPVRSRAGSKRQRSQNSANWEPPPLFQAYPQAIKHALLQATNASAEAIIKTQSHRRQYSLLQEKLESKLDMSTIPEDKADADLKKMTRREKRMSTSSTLGVPELSHKVYVLTTSGHVLQYAGGGPSDRLPEKVLQLGRDSAAFACDLIPGKHWVLQVSHATNDEGVVTAQQPKSFLTRLRVGAAAKKNASTLLLVFDSPDEMGSWLSALRKEIDILAGRRSRSDTTASEDTGPGLQKAPSHRYLVSRDSNRFDAERTPPQSPAETPPNGNAEWSSGAPKVHRNASTATNNTGRLASIRQSMEAPSTAPTSASYEHAQLAQLRESSRISVVSNRTSGTSPDTSTAPPSPGRDAPPIPEDEPPHSPATLKSFAMSPPSTNSNRRSISRPLSSTGESAAENQTSRPARNSRFGPFLPGTQPSTVSQTEEQNAQPVQGPSRPLTSRMSFSRPFNTSPYKPLPTIRSSSAPPVKSPDAEKEPVSTSEPPPGVRVSTVPGASAPVGKTTNRQAPINKPGFRRIPVRPSNFVPPRRISSLGPSLPVKVSPELSAKKSSPQLNSPGADVSEETKPSETSRTPVQTVQRLAEQAPLPAVAKSGLPEVAINSTKVPSHPPKQASVTTTPVPASPDLPSSPFPLQPPVPAQQAQPPQTLRRPVSMQIRSQPGAAFLSNRPGVSSKGPYVRAASVERSSSNGRPPSANNRRPSTPRAGSEQGPDQPRRSVFPRRSMPVMGLPPPAPPPNMPLPPPPSTSPNPDRTAVAV